MLWWKSADAPSWLLLPGGNGNSSNSSSSSSRALPRQRRKLATAMMALVVLFSVAAAASFLSRAGVVHLPGITAITSSGSRPFPPPAVPNFNATAAKNLEKPPDFRIVGLVFYGRRDRVAVLDCYLQRNLARNGGLLDEVLFLARTDDVADLDWLDRLVERTPEYRRVDLDEKPKKGEGKKKTKTKKEKDKPRKRPGGDGGKQGNSNSNSDKNENMNIPSGWNFSDMWRVVRRGVMYVKIDDDIVFVEDSAIAGIVHRRLEHPDAFLVSANVVNHNRIAWLHRKIDAVLPYLPEKQDSRGGHGGLPQPSSPQQRQEGGGGGGGNEEQQDQRSRQRPDYDWRASSLPIWEGKPAHFDRSRFHPPSHRRHRWLPTNEPNVDHTPIADTQEASGSAGAWDWMAGAQQHYSLLHRLETGELDVYRFPLWDLSYDRVSINFMAVWGDDIVESRPIAADDEEYLTVQVPKALKRHVLVDGRGVVAHFSYRRQLDGMETTDLLHRYRAYARENICPEPNLTALKQAQNQTDS